MDEAELFLIMHDPRGPEVTTSKLPNRDLQRLLDALFQNLDTRTPEPSAVFWYEAAARESRRRGPSYRARRWLGVP